MQTVLIVAACAAAVLAAASLVGGYLFFKSSLTRQKPGGDPFGEGSPYRPVRERILAGCEWIEQMGLETVYIESRDGLRLSAVFIKNENAGSRVMLLAHGYHAHRLYDFALSAQSFYSLGFSLLLIDERAHGLSEGKYITMSAKERYDIAEWANYLVKRFGEKAVIVLGGVSMGAASVIGACGLTLPANVKCAIADCGFTSCYKMYCHVAKNMMHVPAFPIVPSMALWCRLIAGFDPKKNTLPEAASRSKTPILFIHGLADSFVPYEMSQENYEACGCQKRIELFPGADHVGSFMVDNARYMRAVSEFTAEWCGAVCNEPYNMVK